MTCRKTNAIIADMLFEPESVPAKVREHVAGCPSCSSELAALEKTMKALEEWRAPEPGAFFDARLYARLRSEEASLPAGRLERIRAWLLYSSKLQVRQWAAAALGVALVIGGGTFALVDHIQTPAVEASATVRDLQSLDANAQFFQQMNALNAPDDSSSGNSN
jgi:anti-sigma factor RsiW